MAKEKKLTATIEKDILKALKKAEKRVTKLIVKRMKEIARDEANEQYGKPKLRKRKKKGVQNKNGAAK
jgi:mRNA-degrading endonuclease RelE of RelBE toxin-antitoxin system